MFLNTNLIKDSVLSKNIITESVNPILQIDQRLESIKLEKERKLQEQVAMIFKDRNYYKRFQESVLPTPLTEKQLKKKADQEEIEAEKESNNRRLKLGAGIALASGIIGTLGTLSNNKKQVHESVTPLTDEQLQEKAAKDKMEADEDRRNNRQIKFGAKAALVGGSMATVGTVLTKVAANSIPYIRMNS